MAKRSRQVRTPGAVRQVKPRQARTRANRSNKTTPRAIPAGRAFQTLVDVMRRLRGPNGCPWDREQSFETLRPFVLEETYEVLEAIDRRDFDDLRGEIGDLLFEGVFLAQIASDEDRFTVADSLQHITDKLIRRHPHVFGSAKHVRTSGQVLEQWEQIKSREHQGEGRRPSVLRGLPKALPALLGAHEIGTRAAAVGFDWATAEDVVAKIEEEVAELRQAARDEPRERVEEEMGDLLFAIANLARKLGIEAESALRRANQKFADRFQKLEQAFDDQGRSVHDASLEEMEATWEAIKNSA
jgi:MazG family protein